MTNVITKSKAIPINKTVLLYSGGLDSLMVAYLLNPDILLYIPSGTVYEDKETRVIKKQIEDGILTSELVILDKELDLIDFERDDAIVPDRNAYLILLAANFGDTIWLGGINGDRSVDTDENFCRMMVDLLDYTHQDQHWTKARKFTITSPLHHLTKTDIIKQFLELGGDPSIIEDSYSCYLGEDKPCGVCKPCVRKAVAMINNGISTVDYFQHNWRDAQWIKQVMPEIKQLIYRGDEDKDFLEALKKDDNGKNKD